MNTKLCCLFLSSILMAASATYARVKLVALPDFEFGFHHNSFDKLFT